MDRQELRLLFERGDVTLAEWVPVPAATIRAVVDEADTRTLCELFPGRPNVTTWYGGKGTHCAGRHKPLDVYQMIEMHYGDGDPKMHRYGDLVRSLLADQFAWLADRGHPRRITDQNGRDALAVACEADALAHRG